MEKLKSDRSDVIAVGLLALHDREFFARLVKDPAKALKEVVAAGKLNLSQPTMDQVVKLVLERNTLHGDAAPLVVWDRYHKSGLWDDRDWMQFWY